MGFAPGPRNLLTDVPGLLVGNVSDARVKTGTTVVLAEPHATGSVAVLGGAPGSRETDVLAPESSTEQVHAVVLSGGSAFGLDAASGVQAWLRERGRGFAVRGHVVPIVPAAVLLDLPNGGDKDWGLYPPYREMGYAACDVAAAEFALGTAGAGHGALTAGLKGGLGSASAILPCGATVAALAAVNPAGSVTIGRGPHFWAAPFEVGGEFGQLGLPSPLPGDASEPLIKHRVAQSGAAQPGANTTLVIVATDAPLARAQARRLAISAHDGMARAIYPVHTPVDGDIAFALSTGRWSGTLALDDMLDLHAAAAAVTARAIARAVYLATPEPGDLFPTWHQRPGAR
ncbi:MAG: P1 family peptidase [Rhizobiaceae bacterium]|nr:P1 family peptidase [Rhizobiaceae bacterium]